MNSKDMSSTLGHVSNTYVLLRHGESKANVARLIVSDPSNGRKAEYGLTERGRGQATQAGCQLLHALRCRAWRAERSNGSAQLEPEPPSSGEDSHDVSPPDDYPTSGLRDRVRIITSDFSRARETADEVARVIGQEYAVDVVEDIRLRERSFGKYELRSSDCYNDVWDADLKAQSGFRDCVYNVEPAPSVARRVSSVVQETEAESDLARYAVVILVSHGDSLQILQTCFLGMSPYRHRSVEHLENCELRIVGPPLD